MTGASIALQLYTLRDAVAADLSSTLQRVAEFGYAGVEPFGLTPESAARTRSLCDELGLDIPSVHVPLPLGDKQAQVLRILVELRPHRVVSGLGAEEFRSEEQGREAAQRLTEAHRVVAEAGYPFGVHNHWWEFEEVDGSLPHHYLLEHLPEDVFFELDVYWMQTGGVDPVAGVGRFAGRAPLLHLKDGPAVVGQPMVALGEGSVDVAGIVRANEPHNEWLIVELDECATDIFAAVERSLRYLEESGLGRGRSAPQA